MLHSLPVRPQLPASHYLLHAGETAEVVASTGMKIAQVPRAGLPVKSFGLADDSTIGRSSIWPMASAASR